MLRIRDFRPADSEKICGYKGESVKEDFPGCPFDREMYRRMLLEFASRMPDFVKIAEVEGKVAGYIWFRMFESVVGPFGRVEDLFVEKKYRDRGIGRRLLSCAEDCLRSRGAGKLKLTVTETNEKAISLYRKMGYKVTRLRMEKDL
jgi:ribosomal-protein-alanine N-acetyltransferase